METALLLKFGGAFVFVISLMYLLAWGLKRLGLGGVPVLAGGKRRLKIVEYLPLDPRRRLVLVRCDAHEHLLLLGGQGELVVASGIVPPAEAAVIAPTDVEAGEINAEGAGHA